MDDTKKKTNIAVIFGGTALFTLLIIPAFFVPGFHFPVILILPTLLALVPAACLSRRKPAKTTTFFRVFIYTIVLGMTVPSFLFTAVLAMLNFTFFIILPILFVLLYFLAPKISTLEKPLICSLPLFSFAASLLIVNAIALEEMEFTNGTSAAGAGASGYVNSPDRRYRFVFDSNGNKICFSIPYKYKYEIFSLKNLEARPTVVRGRKISRFTYTPDGINILALDWNTGPFIMNRGSFKITAEKKIPLPDPSDPFHYEGIAFRTRENQALVARGNGEVLFLSFPDLSVEKKRKCIGESPLLFWTSVQDVFMLDDDDLLVTTTFSGYLFVYDLRRDIITNTRFFAGPMTNVVRSHDGNTFYVGSMFWGLIYKIDVSSMKVIDVMRLETGIRYMTILPDEETLAVTNFFNGNVILYDTIKHERISRVSAGPRIEWIEVSPGGDSFIVSHALGFSVFDIESFRKKPVFTRRNYSFPFYLTRHGSYLDVVLGKTVAYFTMDAPKILSFSVLIAISMTLFVSLYEGVNILRAVKAFLYFIKGN
ncbi:MAG: WD40 repeat domain-containing protein [bacterium]